MKSQTVEFASPATIDRSVPVVTREREYLRRLAEQEQRIEATGRRSYRRPVK